MKSSGLKAVMLRTDWIGFSWGLRVTWVVEGLLLIDSVLRQVRETFQEPSYRQGLGFGKNNLK